MIKLFEQESSQPIKTLAASRFTLSVIGLFTPIVRELKEMLYQFEEDYWVDDSRF
jgi:hypothetical protein